jgi:penicillin-binding protein 1A
LKRTDLAGKTGTTNDYVDAWFCGYQPSVVGVAWIGFDQPKRLGNGETGGSAALPIWIGYMETALKNVPEMHREVPQGMTKVDSRDPATGASISDIIYQEALPPPDNEAADSPAEPVLKQAPAPVQDAQPKLIAPDRRVSMPNAPNTPNMPANSTATPSRAEPARSPAR